MKSNNSRGFWSYFISVVLKPWVWFWIFGVPTAVMSFATLVRDNFLAKEWEEKLATQKYIPSWQWRTWALVLMGLAVCSIIRNGFLAWKAERNTADDLRSEVTNLKEAPLPFTAPQLELDSETTSDFPIKRLLLRNISQSEPIFNIRFQPVRPGADVYVNWIAENEAVLQPMTQMPIGPIVMKANGELATDFNGVYSIVELLKKEKIAPSYDIGPVSFSCEDRVQNRYMVTFKVEVSFSVRTMRVIDLDRRRIGSRPSRA